jgi:hypothetical protein
MIISTCLSASVIFKSSRIKAFLAGVRAGDVAAGATAAEAAVEGEEAEVLAVGAGLVSAAPAEDPGEGPVENPVEDPAASDAIAGATASKREAADKTTLSKRIIFRPLI